VGNIAYKTPEMSSVLTTDHGYLCLGDLLGQAVKMSRVPVLLPGHRTMTGGREGVIYGEPPEMVALQRWQKKDFLGVEREFARVWRNALLTMDLTAFRRIVRNLSGEETKLRDLAEARALAGRMVLGDGRRYKTLHVALDMLAIPAEFRSLIVTRWKEAGRPSLDKFAPYAAYVFSVDLFFYLALDAGLIRKSTRPSNRIDVGYLYYLPFCMIFTSGDLLHRDMAPHFLGADQTFIWAPDLKDDLRRLDAHYSALPQETKKRGVIRFAGSPPKDGDFLTSRLWDRFLRRTWREPERPLSEAVQKQLHAMVGPTLDLHKAGARSGQSLPYQTGGKRPDHVTIKRQVHAQRGKWRILPPEVDAKKDR
jgi:hypothetical protein